MVPVSRTYWVRRHLPSIDPLPQSNVSCILHGLFHMKPICGEKIPLLFELLFDLVQQGFSFYQVVADQRDVDERAKLEQVLLHQVLVTLAARQQEEAA